MPSVRCGPVRVHQGIRDASAAVSYRRGTSLFLLAADEDAERTLLRLYDADQDGGPVREFEVSKEFLSLDPRRPEIDLEAATCVGPRMYWIGSHSRNKEGERRPSRHRLFATELKKGIPVPIGRPYRTLVQDVGLDIDAPSSPKQGGLSIEGLTATNKPGELLIALRSPLIEDKAMLIPLRNADEVVHPGIEPKYGRPILLDLDGLGIRSIDHWCERDSYYILAGPVSRSGQDFRLYRWSGSVVEDLGFDFGGLNLGPGVAPEGLLVEAASETLYVFFDEGNRKSPGEYFRSISILGL